MPRRESSLEERMTVHDEPDRLPYDDAGPVNLTHQHWDEDGQCLAALVRWLRDRGEIGDSVEDAAAVIERAWHWSAEWGEFVREMQSEAA